MSSLQTNCRLYVGNLDPDFTDDEISQKFSSIGPVAIRSEVIFGRIHRYALISLEKEDEVARALDELKFVLLKDRPNHVTRYRQEDAKVFIRNLEGSINDKDLYNAFAVSGKIESCEIAYNDKGKSVGVGYVQFETEDAAKECILQFVGKKINNQTIHVEKFYECKEDGMDENQKVVIDFKMAIRNAFFKRVGKKNPGNEDMQGPGTSGNSA